LGLINVPTNFLASVALHFSGILAMLQYLFGHRSSGEPCPDCAKSRRYDIQRRVQHPSSPDQWWLHNFIEDRSYVTATMNTPSLESPVDSKFDIEGSDVERSSVRLRAISSIFPQRPSMRPLELPDSVFLPRLTLRLDRYNSPSLSSTPGSSNNVTPEPSGPIATPRPNPSPYLNFLRKSRQLV
jgi:hypothetical protein